MCPKLTEEEKAERQRELDNRLEQERLDKLEYDNQITDEEEPPAPKLTPEELGPRYEEHLKRIGGR